MTKIAYLQCPTGLAGDMCLGALVDAGVPVGYLIEHLDRLGIGGEYKLWAESVQRNGQAATKVHVELVADITDARAVDQPTWSDPNPTFARISSPDPAPIADHTQHSISPDPAHDHSHDHSEGQGHSHHHPHEHSHGHHAPPHTTETGQHPPTLHAGRHLPEIESLIRAARLPDRAEGWSLAVFRRLAEAEGAVHGIAPEQVHFHEVGAIDAIVDIVGTCLGLDWLNIERLYCSPMPTGSGTIRAAHGLLTVPTPAVLKLWAMRQVPIYSNGIERELVTPTGAAIATTLATEFGPPPPMILHRVGLGAGSRNLPIPNIMQLWLGETDEETVPRRERSAQRSASQEGRGTSIGMSGIDKIASGNTSNPNPSTSETVAVLETQIDDLTPQAIAYASESLFATGAVDVFTQPVIMKKSRLGTLITVICPPGKAADCEAVLFRETSTLGVRWSMQHRTILYRTIETVTTPYGLVPVKVARRTQNGPVLNVQPEYEDCARLAREHEIPWRQVQQVALRSWQDLSNQPQ